MLILIILCFAGVAESAVQSGASQLKFSQQVRSSRAVRGHDICYHNDHHYRDIFNNAERENCNTPYSMFGNLDYLGRHNHQCLDTLVRAIANLHLPECDCHQAHIHYPQQGDYYHYSRCMQHNVYREVANTYLTYFHNGRSTIVGCQSRNRVYRDLLRLLNDRLDCFYDFVNQMKVAYDHNHEPHCSCHEHSHTQVTQSSHHELTHNELQQAYERGECLGEHTVWKFLYDDTGYLHGINREHVIATMAERFPKGMDDKCICNKTADLHYHVNNRQDNIAWHCANLQEAHSYPYRTAISHLLDHINFVHSSPQRCHSHIAVWWELDNLVKHNHHGKICVENLIHHMYDAVLRQGDPCSCHAESTTVSPTTKTTQTTTTTTATTPAPTTTKSTTSTTVPTTIKTTVPTTIKTTVPTTIKTTQPINNSTTQSSVTTTTSEITTNTSNTTSLTQSTTQGVSSTPGQTTECSKIRTVTELGQFHQLYPQFNVDCSNQVSSSNLIVRDLCDSVPNSAYWKPGTRVVDACDTLKTYQPIATFSSNIFPVDGLAGIFLGCTSTSIRIATQECGDTFKILELARHPTQSEIFTHTASNYYVINH